MERFCYFVEDFSSSRSYCLMRKPSRILCQWPDTQPPGLRMSLPALGHNEKKRARHFARWLRQCKTLGIRWMAGIDWERFLSPVEIRQLLTLGYQPIGGIRGGQAAAQMGFDLWLFEKGLRLSESSCAILGGNSHLGSKWVQKLMPLVAHLQIVDTDNTADFQPDTVDFIVHAAGALHEATSSFPLVWYADPARHGGSPPRLCPPAHAAGMTALEGYCLAESALSLHDLGSGTSDFEGRLSAIGWRVEIDESCHGCNACRGRDDTCAKT